MIAERAARRRGGNAIHAVEPAHLLDEVRLPFQIQAIGGNLKRDGLRRGGGRVERARFAVDDSQAQLAQVGLDLRRGQGDAEQLVDLPVAQNDPPPGLGVRVSVSNAFDH